MNNAIFINLYILQITKLEQTEINIFIIIRQRLLPVIDLYRILKLQLTKKDGMKGP